VRSNQFRLLLASFLALTSTALASTTPAANIQTERSTGNPAIASASTVAPAELTASDGAAGNALGTAVAVSGNTVVVGENCGQIGGNTNCNPQHQGAVYVYQMPKNGWGNMTQTAELAPSDGFVGGGFGTSVAISGSTIVVGAVSGHL